MKIMSVSRAGTENKLIHKCIYVSHMFVFGLIRRCSVLAVTLVDFACIAISYFYGTLFMMPVFVLLA